MEASAGTSEGGAERTPGIYSIGAVSRLLGVPTQTLRAWEERYQKIVPARSGGGQRLYSRDQVDQLRFVREQIENGLQPADAHRLLDQRNSEAHAIPSDRVDVPERGDETTVLIAELDPYAAEFAEYFLRTEGYAVHIVLDADQAAAILREDPPSVLVVDLMISGGAGLELCRRARESGPLPVLAVSAVDLQDEALAAGVEAFLVKPFEPLRFVSTVRDLLGTSAYLRTGS